MRSSDLRRKHNQSSAVETMKISEASFRQTGINNETECLICNSNSMLSSAVKVEKVALDPRIEVSLQEETGEVIIECMIR